MKILIHGDDTFQNLQTFNEIVSQFKQKHQAQGKNIFTYSSKDDLKPVINLLNQSSLFAIKQLIIINDCQDFKVADTETISQINNRVNNNTTVIYRANKNLSDKNKIEAELLKVEKVFFHPVPNQIILEKWIQDTAKKNGLKLSPIILKKILTFTSDKWVLNNLIKQLAAHAKTSDDINQESVLDLLVIYNDTTPIFAITDSLANGNEKNAIKILHQYLNNGAEPLMILGLLAKHIRDLISAKNNLQGNFKSEYAYTKMVKSAQRFSLAQLSLWQQNVILTDIAIKKGQPALSSINSLVIKMANLTK